MIARDVGFGGGLVGKLLIFDARSMRFETLRYRWNPENPLSGKSPTIRDLSASALILYQLRLRRAERIWLHPGIGYAKVRLE